MFDDGIPRHFELLYKGSENGFNGEELYARCKGEGSTICFILSEHGYVFGGYVSIDWEEVSEFIDDPEAFIFSLTY